MACAPGANDRVRVAVMGVRGRGQSHVTTLLAQPGVEITHLCEVDSNVVGAVVSRIDKASGKAPGVVEDIRKVEAHLIGFEGDLYGRPLALDFIARLRDLQKFAGADALARQLRQDVAEAKRLTTERAAS